MITGISLFRKHAAHEKDAPIVEAVQATVRYSGTLALDNVSFHLNRGERIAVVGPNGAGKSTLFKVIAGILDPSSGEVRIAGHIPGEHICIAYVPQRAAVDWAFPVTVADVVMMGRVGRIGVLRRPGHRDRELVHRSLEVVGLLELAERQIGELSGGQQQRMFIARALAQEAELMLMDEPFTGLDATARDGILRILDELRQMEVTVMVSTHDLELAAAYFDRVMLLNHRLLGIGRPAEVFTAERLQQAYGSHFHLMDTKEGVMALSDTCCGHGE